MTQTEENDINNWFKYHPATPELVEKYNHVRESSKQLAKWLYENVPNSADRTAAIRSLRRTVMDINLAIACNTLALLLFFFAGCAQSHEITEVTPVHEGAAGGPAFRVAPGSPASDTWEGSEIDYERWANGTKSPDVGVTVSALTLHSTFKCRNSEGGAAINRSPGSSWDLLRAYVMTQGSTSSSLTGCNANYWECQLFAGNRTECWRPSAPNTKFKADGCSSSNCTISKGAFGGSWTLVGVASFGANPFIFSGAMDGYPSIQAQLESGNAVVRRYTN